MKNGESEKHEDDPRCPSCNSIRIEVVTEGHTQGYDAASGCCGALLLGPLGLLCGACGMGGKHREAKRMCIKCGKKF